jgi:hypothetical protein
VARRGVQLAVGPPADQRGARVGRVQARMTRIVVDFPAQVRILCHLTSRNQQTCPVCSPELTAIPVLFLPSAGNPCPIKHCGSVIAQRGNHGQRVRDLANLHAGLLNAPPGETRAARACVSAGRSPGLNGGLTGLG